MEGTKGIWVVDMNLADESGYKRRGLLNLATGAKIHPHGLNTGRLDLTVGGVTTVISGEFNTFVSELKAKDLVVNAQESNPSYARAGESDYDYMRRRGL
jgi:hypothetical protein